MAAVVLADGKNITRVSVPKALIQQTGLLLHSRLGGLPGRELRHVPFSRRTPSDRNTISAFKSLHEEMRSKAGVMICLPEHQLSFMLSSFQRLVDKKVSEGSDMVQVQSWLTSHARDIIDESDYTLAVRTQLVYPSGNQVTVDGHPERWLMVEKILEAVRCQLHDLKQCFPSSIDVIERPNSGYPFVYFLRPDVEEELLSRLRAGICSGSLGLLPVSHLEPGEVEVVRTFISSPVVSEETMDIIKRICPRKPRIRRCIYHLRGLLVNRILMMTLKKRWNVQYGLHERRDPIAVPYHAKGVPSEMSEWGHPDVAILFTVLAFYYSGLSRMQLRQALEHLFKSDDPSSEYDRWVQYDTPAPFPDSLKDWISINLDDPMQLEALHKVLRFNVVAVDYFLNNLVFPDHSKQFHVKLQSSGWDLPVFSRQPRGEPSGRVIVRNLSTGFSGTNDNRHMLPLTIKQHDLPALAHTNAEVLTYLLQPRSRDYHVLIGKSGRLDELGMLELLTSRSIRVLIDAGAQVLEMSNEELANKWLDIDSSALAALYFDNDNKAWICTRGKTKTPLLASPFADDLNQVLVYLDQVCFVVLALEIGRM